jgi:hypothetical protein
MSMTSDPFTDFGEALAPIKKRAKVGAREAKRQEKARQDRNCLSRAYRRWRKEAVDALLSGPFGADAQALIDFLEHMELSDGSDLIEQVQSGPWRGADENTRFLILVLIDAAIIHLRERTVLAPFDDPLDEKSNVFLLIRKLLQ